MEPRRPPVFAEARFRRRSKPQAHRGAATVYPATAVAPSATWRDAALTARGESLAAFDGRCILAGCVAPPLNTPGIRGRRALPARRLARLGATPHFHHGLLDGFRTCGNSRPRPGRMIN